MIAHIVCRLYTNPWLSNLLAPTLITMYKMETLSLIFTFINKVYVRLT